MKTKDIKVGKSYSNRGAGRTVRKVIGIGKEYRPAGWYGIGAPPPSGIGVEYESCSKGEVLRNRLYLESFAAWAGKEVG